MILRPRQVRAVNNCVHALNEYNNTLLVAATGFGKTIALSAVNQKMMLEHGIDKALCLQHRDEIADQNLKKFRKVTGKKISVSRFDSKSKSFRGRMTFGMVQSVVANLDRMPKIDMLTIDEGHRAPANSYQEIIKRARELNKDLKIFVTTATPCRGDRKTLRGTVDNVADDVSISELIASGHLVKPKMFKPQVGDLRESVNSVTKTASDYDMSAVAELMDREVVTDEVIRHWREMAGDRKTIIFTANIAHTEHVAEAFKEAGVKAAAVHSKMNGSRKSVMDAFERNEIQVVVNPMILTEGFDDQTVECVVILRPAAYQSTFVQMVGRGLRTVDPELHPGFIKRDCIILDFGSTHESLDQDAEYAIAERDDEPGEAPKKTCPECESEVPTSIRECPICGYEFPAPDPGEKGTIDYVRLAEVDLLEKSSFKYVDLFGNDKTLFTSGFRAWGGIINYNGQDWCSIGGAKYEDGKPDGPPKILGVGDRAVCIARVDDWVGENEPNKAAGKNKRWLKSQATPKQIGELERYGRWDNASGFNKYGAACRINYMKNEPSIVDVITRTFAP